MSNGSVKISVIKAEHATSKVLESQGVNSVRSFAISHRQSAASASFMLAIVVVAFATK